MLHRDLIDAKDKLGIAQLVECLLRDDRINLETCGQNILKDVLKVVHQIVDFAFGDKNEEAVEIVQKLPLKLLLERAFSPFSAVETDNNEVIKLGAMIFGNLFCNNETLDQYFLNLLCPSIVELIDLNVFNF